MPITEYIDNSQYVFLCLHWQKKQCTWIILHIQTFILYTTVWCFHVFTAFYKRFNEKNTKDRKVETLGYSIWEYPQTAFCICVPVWVLQMNTQALQSITLRGIYCQSRAIEKKLHHRHAYLHFTYPHNVCISSSFSQRKVTIEKHFRENIIYLESLQQHLWKEMAVERDFQIQRIDVD